MPRSWKLQQQKIHLEHSLHGYDLRRFGLTKRILKINITFCIVCQILKWIPRLRARPKCQLGNTVIKQIKSPGFFHKIIRTIFFLNKPNGHPASCDMVVSCHGPLPEKYSFNVLYLYCDKRRDMQSNIAWARGKSQGRRSRDFLKAQAIFHCISWLESQYRHSQIQVQPFFRGQKSG